jgi:hypothetical protein
MDNRVSDEIARNRFLVIGLARFSGVALVLIAILILTHTVDLPDWIGFVILAAGLVDIFLVPQWLARKWATPRE